MQVKNLWRSVLPLVLLGVLAGNVQAGGFFKKLFGKGSECCEPVCCEPAPEPECCTPEPECCTPEPEPVCCEPAPEPVCCEPAPEPVCCEPAPEPACCEPAPEPCCASVTTLPTGLVWHAAPVSQPAVPTAYVRQSQVVAVTYAGSPYPATTPAIRVIPSSVARQSVRYVSLR